MPRVPDRWLNYSSHGKAVVDIFVALKVPLATNYNVPEVEKFTPRLATSKLPLGLIIDLTNTTRYYDRNEFINCGVEHEKLFVQGHVVPKMTLVESFITIVNGFVKNGNREGKLIGVHCTHGVNRTGYLICAYLILEMGFRADDAIQLFNKQRGHKMERKNYLMSLRSLKKQEPDGRVGGGWTHREMNRPNQSRADSKHHVEKPHQPMSEQMDMRPQDYHHHHDHHRYADDRRDTRQQGCHNNADHNRHRDKRREPRRHWNHKSADPLPRRKHQQRDLSVRIIDNSDPETRRTTDFPTGVRRGVPKRTD